MEAMFKKFKELFTVKDETVDLPTTNPVYTYYAEIDMEEWYRQGKPSVQEFLKNYGAVRLYGSEQEHPPGCVGVEKGWKVIMRIG
jgi:hypothetical protein